jgi:hypothetical protein
MEWDLLSGTNAVAETRKKLSRTLIWRSSSIAEPAGREDLGSAKTLRAARNKKTKAAAKRIKGCMIGY